VVEVGYDHFAGGRFRHGTKFVRWRPDKDTGACRIEQEEKEGRTALGLL
jgi:ATP-dependent DNA ligase